MTTHIFFGSIGDVIQLLCWNTFKDIENSPVFYVVLEILLMVLVRYQIKSYGTLISVVEHKLKFSTSTCNSTDQAKVCIYLCW